MTEEEYEPAWNCEVHSSVLKIALRPYEAVNQRNMYLDALGTFFQPWLLTYEPEPKPAYRPSIW